MRVVGVDGVGPLWLAADVRVLGTGAGRVRWHLGTAREVLALADDPDVAAVGVDVPVGLLPHGTRTGEGQARRRLGRAASSVFSTPPQPALALARLEPPSRSTRRAADAAARAAGAGGVSVQAWFIASKVLEVEDAVRGLGAAGERVQEVHPETAYATAARGLGRPAPASKRSGRGVGQRMSLLAQVLPDLDVVAALASLPERGPAHGRGTPARVPVDDALDALAAAWSARRWADGTAEVLGADDAGRAVWSDGTPAPGRAVLVV